MSYFIREKMLEKSKEEMLDIAEREISVLIEEHEKETVAKQKQAAYNKSQNFYREDQRNYGALCMAALCGIAYFLWGRFDESVGMNWHSAALEIIAVGVGVYIFIEMIWRATIELFGFIYDRFVGFDVWEIRDKRGASTKRLYVITIFIIVVIIAAIAFTLPKS